jgi:hypothetical protein
MITYRVIVSTLDFFGLIVGAFVYLGHEMAWHRYGSSREPPPGSANANKARFGVWLLPTAVPGSQKLAPPSSARTIFGEEAAAAIRSMQYMRRTRRARTALVRHLLDAKADRRTISPDG